MYTLLKPPLSADISASLPMISVLLRLLVRFIPVGLCTFMKDLPGAGNEMRRTSKERCDGCDQEIRGGFVRNT